MSFKSFILVLTGFCPGWILGQYDLENLSFESNATFRDSMNSPLFQFLGDRYTFATSLEIRSYWSSVSLVRVIALENSGKWFKMELIQDQESIELSLHKKKRIRPKRVETIESVLNEENLLSLVRLDIDSLNLTMVQLPDTIIDGVVLKRESWKSVSDGRTFTFQVFANGQHGVIPAYEPKLFYNSFPEIWQRKVFLDFLESYFGIWEDL